MSKVVEVMARAIIGAPLQTARPAAMAQAALDALDAAGFVVVPNSAIDWLDGAAPDADGKWFGDDVPVGRPYWWRAKFRAMIEASRVTP